MEEKIPRHDEDLILQSVYSRINWPYKDVDVELREKSLRDKPFGPFHSWLSLLGIDAGTEEGLEKSHLLLCILNFAALHENKIEDTRDFLAFFWWYVEKIKPLPGYNDTDKRKSAYHDLIVQILLKTNSLLIGLFSPAGDIYSVILFAGENQLNNYDALKIKFEKIYINMAGGSAGFFLYENLRETDEAFYNVLRDKEKYNDYIEEIPLEKISDAKGSKKFALIKMPDGKNILMPPEFLCQTAWLSFIKFQQCFYNPDNSLKNEKFLSSIIEKVNAENKKDYNLDQALCLIRDWESLGIEHDFWEQILGAISSVKPPDMGITPDILMYSSLLSRLLPEKTGAGFEEDLKKEADIPANDIDRFYEAISADKTADYTFAVFMKKFPGFPFAPAYRGIEKRFIERSLDRLINSGKITKLREPAQNISHFIVSKNILFVFVHYIEQAHDELLAAYKREFEEGKIRNEDEYLAWLEKRISGNYPVFRELFINKEFSGYIYRMLEKTGTDISKKYKDRLFGETGAKQDFLPLAKLLNLGFAQYKAKDAPGGPGGPEEKHGALDFIKPVLPNINKMVSGISKTLSDSIEKDLERKKGITGGNAVKKTLPGTRTENKKEIEASLRAIAGKIIEEFMGSGQMHLEEMIETLGNIWNDPETINRNEINILKKENFIKMNTLIRDSTLSLDPVKIDRAAIETRASEIASYNEVNEIIKNTAKKAGAPENLRRYIALYIIDILINRGG
jgi:hypothetical protein